MSTEVGTNGEVDKRVTLRELGSWGVCIDSYNTLIDNVLEPMDMVQNVIDSVASGDLTNVSILMQNEQILHGKYKWYSNHSLIRLC